MCCSKGMLSAIVNQFASIMLVWQRRFKYRIPSWMVLLVMMHKRISIVMQG